MIPMMHSHEGMITELQHWITLRSGVCMHESDKSEWQKPLEEVCKTQANRGHDMWIRFCDS